VGVTGIHRRNLVVTLIPNEALLVEISEKWKMGKIYISMEAKRPKQFSGRMLRDQNWTIVHCARTLWIAF